MMLTSKGTAGVAGGAFVVLASSLTAIGSVPVAALALSYRCRVDARPPDGALAVRDLLAQNLPDFVIDTIGFRGEGLENVAYDINSEFILRISKEADPIKRASLVSNEADLLAIVAPLSPLPIPAPMVVADSALLYPHSPAGPCWTCPRTSGRAMARRSRPCWAISSPPCTTFRSTWSPTTSTSTTIRRRNGFRRPPSPIGPPPLSCPPGCAPESRSSSSPPRRTSRTPWPSRTTTSASSTCWSIPRPPRSPVSSTGRMPHWSIRPTTSVCCSAIWARTRCVPRSRTTRRTARRDRSAGRVLCAVQRAGGPRLGRRRGSGTLRAQGSRSARPAILPMTRIAAVAVERGYAASRSS